jgi:uncharacterized membrane protein YbaN (DUF454 family)
MSEPQHPTESVPATAHRSSGNAGATTSDLRAIGHWGPVRILLLAAGTMSVALAILGIFLPLLPTTPLLLLAAWCFARSSQRVYRLLLANRWLGSYIRNYRDGRGMTARAKTSSLVVLWLAIFISVVSVAPIWWVQLLLVGIAAGISLFLLRLPTCQRDS